MINLVDSKMAGRQLNPKNGHPKTSITDYIKKLR